MAITFTKTTWVDLQDPYIDAAQLNRIENAIGSLVTVANDAVVKTPTTSQWIVGQYLGVERATVGAASFANRVTGDAYARLSIVDNIIKFGPGNADQDVTLYRTGVGAIGVDGIIDVGYDTRPSDPLLRFRSTGRDQSIYFLEAGSSKAIIGTRASNTIFRIASYGIDDWLSVVLASGGLITIGGSTNRAVNFTGALLLEGTGGSALGHVGSVGSFFTNAAVGDAAIRAKGGGVLRLGVGSGSNASTLDVSAAGISVAGNLQAAGTQFLSSGRALAVVSAQVSALAHGTSGEYRMVASDYLGNTAYRTAVQARGDIAAAKLPTVVRPAADTPGMDVSTEVTWKTITADMDFPVEFWYYTGGGGCTLRVYNGAKSAGTLVYTSSLSGGTLYHMRLFFSASAILAEIGDSRAFLLRPDLGNANGTLIFTVQGGGGVGEYLVPSFLSYTRA